MAEGGLAPHHPSAVSCPLSSVLSFPPSRERTETLNTAYKITRWRLEADEAMVLEEYRKQADPYLNPIARYFIRTHPNTMTWLAFVLGWVRMK